MGFHSSWIAVRGKPAEKVRSELRLKETAERESLPEADVTAVALPSGWYVVFFNDPLPSDLEERALARLSAGAELMMFVVEEASKVSLASGYSGGRRIWTLGHDSSKGPTHLDAQGALPEIVSKIRDRLLAQSRAGASGVDHVFDLPAELSKTITGFRHDEEIEGVGGEDGDAFVVLQRL